MVGGLKHISRRSFTATSGVPVSWRSHLNVISLLPVFKDLHQNRADDHHLCPDDNVHGDLPPVGYFRFKASAK